MSPYPENNNVINLSPADAEKLVKELEESLGIHG